MIRHSFKAFVAAALFLPAALHAQAVKFDLGKIQYEDLKTPRIDGGVSKKFDAKDWLEVEIEVEALAKPEPKDGFLPSGIAVRWYVAFKDADGKGVTMVTKDIDYVNIPVGEKFFVSAYMSPNTIRRISGGDRAGKSVVEAVGVEVLYDGRVVGEESTKGALKKWTQSPKVSRSSNYNLFAKNETPFQMLWYDRYAEIAPNE